MPPSPTQEHSRLEQSTSHQANWQRWGTYLPERQWGTVREDLSPDGNSWAFGYDQARSTAYRWGEDGLLGWTDRECRLCFSLALWNGCDAHIKERLFGLTNPEGNHGEDVKELYYYLDATPTHSYARALYKYPQVAFPYDELRTRNREAGLDKPEWELLDTGIFHKGLYFDVEVEYAKSSPDETLVRITATNRADQPAFLWLLPMLYFRNTWSVPTPEPLSDQRPVLTRTSATSLLADHPTLGTFTLDSLFVGDAEASFFLSENESGDGDGATLSKKGASDVYVRTGPKGRQSAAAIQMRDRSTGTRAVFLSEYEIGAGSNVVLRLRLAPANADAAPSDAEAFDAVFEKRRAEADEFYDTVLPKPLDREERNVARQAYAGLLWSKQFYFYVGNGFTGSQKRDTPATDFQRNRNRSWSNLYCRNILSVPDKWEYPWFAAWDSAFQLVTMARIDMNFAKEQLLILLREWYLHPDGQLPAYEYNFSDANPPVHAWAVLRVFELGARAGSPDYDFLERAFQKILLNFTWWVNRLDPDGTNIFGGGFLGLDNIEVFDRSSLPPGIRLGQADGTAWMGLYCASMLEIALILARHSRVYEDIANKFFQHYVALIDAFNNLGGTGLWDDELGFFCDKLIAPGKPPLSLKLCSVVGLIPVFGLCLVPEKQLESLPEFARRVRWYRENRPDLAGLIGKVDQSEVGTTYFLSLVQTERLRRICERLFDQEEFLSPHGIRSLSRRYGEEPYRVELEGHELGMRYAPAEGDTRLFGGNSNWRGPVWFPVNVLLLEALKRYGELDDPNTRVEFPRGSGKRCSLPDVMQQIARNLSSIFLFDERGNRPCHGGEPLYSRTGPWSDLVLFNEYFSGEDGRGVGASHQTGWSVLAVIFLELCYQVDPSATRSTPQS